MDAKTLAAIFEELTEEERWKVLAFIGQLKTKPQTVEPPQTEGKPERRPRRSDPIIALSPQAGRGDRLQLVRGPEGKDDPSGAE